MDSSLSVIYFKCLLCTIDLHSQNAHVCGCHLSCVCVCVCVCQCVCVCAHMLRIVSMDRILCITNALIISIFINILILKKKRKTNLKREKKKKKKKERRLRSSLILFSTLIKFHVLIFIFSDPLPPPTSHPCFV